MQTLRAGDLVLEAAPRGPQDPIRLHWRGKSNDRHPGKILAPHFATALEEAAAQGVPIEMHFEALDHFNSSTITALIQLIQSARSKGVRLVLVYNQQLKWQKLSFDALRVFAKGDGLLDLQSAQG
jgi:hypothetical protein